MTCDNAHLMVEKEIKELTVECKVTKAQALGLPPYHQGSESTTRSKAIATNTPWDELLLSAEECPLETAVVETRAMRRWTPNGAEMASTLHQHIAHIK